MTNPSMRIDKFLWAVRIFKSRNQATDACRKGKIKIQDQPIKPGHPVKEGDVILVRKNQINYTYRIINLTYNRLPAKEVIRYIEDLTPAEELEKLKIQRAMYGGVQRLPGRPTKKNRRMLDKFINPDFPEES